nr:hypothetical protein GCM10025699_58810 [Microbacterium flavescens]
MSLVDAPTGGTEEARGLLLTNARPTGRDGSLVDVLIESGEVSAMAPDITPASGVDVVDLDGRWLGPGLWDSHVHMDQWALVRQRLDLSSARSAAEAASLVGERLRGQPPAAGRPLIGYGFQDALWPDTPTRALLDSVSGDVPVVLVSKDLHAVWLDSRALEQHGHGGHPTGLLREQAAFDVNTAVSAVSEELLDDWVAEAVEAASARGVVGVVDLEMTLSIDRWARRVAGGVRGLRVQAGVYPQDLDGVIARGLRTGDVVEGTEGLVTMGPFKIITDGSLNTRTAYCHDPYPGLEGDPAARGCPPTRRTSSSAGCAAPPRRAWCPRSTPSATRRTPWPSTRSRRSAAAAASSTPSCSTCGTSTGSPGSASWPVCSPSTPWTTATSPTATGPAVPGGPSRSRRSSRPV